MNQRKYRLFIDISGTANTQEDLKGTLLILMQACAEKDIDLHLYLISGDSKETVERFVDHEQIRDLLKASFSSVDIQEVQSKASSFKRELQFDDSDVIALIDDSQFPDERLKLILGRKVTYEEAHRYFIHYEGGAFAPLPFTDYFEKMMDVAEQQPAGPNGAIEDPTTLAAATTEEVAPVAAAPTQPEKDKITP